MNEIWRDTFETNPLLAPWTRSPSAARRRSTACGVADLKPALEAAMAEKLREVERIAADPEAPTFANTLVALERAGQTFQAG